MFNRIRRAAYVLSYSPKIDPYNHPGIVFREVEAPPVPTTASKIISGMVSSVAIALAFGSLSAFLFKNLPVATTTVAVGAVAVILSQLWHHIMNAIQKHVDKTLRIGDRIAPFFGHRITKAIQTIRK